ncbi:tRNA lysidine(34) synthetase TilS [Pseudochrobactrum algeriensis]|uniref:tRNA lysidine(34) synthetase TilS n=1 Tax=Pseudochrobactrum algeriensis TaxID=2834768 RepID=UPI001BCAA63D|nr:tRNA lysidine(34) synthetase TilS [Pseudochrobactrum algeriensis]MBX8813998.1 tRNA lysidine(34) synthetase TilS [Ochrobactrum sp. MR34]QVQ36402.1 tRNA lysidine(34) synthetase TilS [Pseudochrobactrum algeriensis]QVQ39620.1 tRNA lysidine(34) synthetase TilS [Pseudochrobactrum algeriensis]QVQ43540.1 tRNA lysidine(34) synthetase TilS [Pseudochrobactrum algeriensis]
MQGTDVNAAKTAISDGGTAMLMPDFLPRIFTGFDNALAGQHPSVMIVAVSGGSDSLALLLQTRLYLQEKLPECRLIAVTVDHRLRAESADEAAGVAEFCKNIGIAHQILCWTGEKPASGLASAARSARYDLLVQAARHHQADIILTGHTADDQVETYLMRREREGLTAGLAGAERGLAAMAVQTLLQTKVLLCRPLLDIWRGELRGFLSAHNIRWVDDPSNENPAYERPRVRQVAKMLDKPALLQAVDAAAVQRRADNHRVADLLKQENSQIRLLAGDSLFLPAGWGASDRDIIPLTLGYLLAAIGGQAFLPALRDCAELTNWLDKPSIPAGQRKTLHRCVIEKSRHGTIIRRERRNLPVIPLQREEEALWDGRYHIRNEGTEPLVIAALSEKQLSAYLQQHKIGTGEGKQGYFDRNSLLAAPAVFCDGVVTCFPALSGLVPQSSEVRIKCTLACFDRVLSGHDFEVAQVVKGLLTMPFNHNYR